MYWRNALISILSLVCGGLGYLVAHQRANNEALQNELDALKTKVSLQHSDTNVSTEGRFDIQIYYRWLAENFDYTEIDLQHTELFQILESRERDTIWRLLKILRKRHVISEEALQSVVLNDTFENARAPISQICFEIYKLTPFEIDDILKDLEASIFYHSPIWGQDWQ